MLGGAAPLAAAQAARFDIPAQPLADALRRFADQTGVQLVFSPGLTADRRSSALQGDYEPDQALRQLLRGSGLTLRRDGATWTVVSAADGQRGLADVLVTADVDRAVPAIDLARRIQREGSEAAGYRTETVSSVGVLGGMRVLDAPFAVNTISQDLIRNVHAQSPDDVYRIHPSTVSQTPQLSGWAPLVKIRGFNIYDRAEDGLRRSYSYAASLEDKERVEVLNGLSGFLYGASAPGGMVNYVNKRPTADPYRSVVLGTYGASQAYLHADVGGPIDSGGRLGYRINVVRQDGDTAVDDQKIDRTLISGAFDWRLLPRLKLELNASASRYRMTAPTAYWSFGAAAPRIAAPDTSRDWSQPWIRDEIRQHKWSGRLVYEVNDSLTVRVAHMREGLDRPTQDHTMNSVTADDGYRQIGIHSGDTSSSAAASQALADLRFDTGPVLHRLTLGYYGLSERSRNTLYSPNSGWQGPYPFGAPTHVAQPAWPAAPADAGYDGGRTRNHNFVVGDWLRWGERWSAIVGVNRSRIESRTLAADGTLDGPAYGDSRLSPNLSLMYQPTPRLTTYATYVEGLEQGGIAPETAVNRFAVMPPMVSRQREIGVKAELGGMLVGGALFDIAKAYEYTNADNVYGQEGRQRHRGVELSAIGKLSRQWTLVSGLTWLSAKVEGGDNDGLAPINTPKLVAKVYVEYAVTALPGLHLAGGLYHVGKQWAQADNSSRLPSYTTLDLGLRYAIEVAGRPLSLRLFVNNATDRDYWLNSYYLGTPRSIALSAQMVF
ncbi:MAG: TonB-dependent receptor [Burkholderiaceae bacterium]